MTKEQKEEADEWLDEAPLSTSGVNSRGRPAWALDDDFDVMTPDEIGQFAGRIPPSVDG
jgi:hypothetical protein